MTPKLSVPSFGSQHYWEERFTKNPEPHEWLEAPTALDPYLVAALANTKDPGPQILHIGCGTSLLSYHLRAHVKNPESIHNVDYSEVAIRQGRQREHAIFAAKGTQETPEEQSSIIGTTNGGPTNESEVCGGKSMRWSSVNLLSYKSVLAACKPRTYSVIVDKSTSDSIACTDDVYVPLPYPVSTSKRHCSSTVFQSEPIHPVHVLAIHMALLVKPGTRWISLSYSMDRFSFLDRYPLGVTGKQAGNRPEQAEGHPEQPTKEQESSDDGYGDDLDDIPQDVIDNGLPHPGSLWELEAEYEMEAPAESVPKGQAASLVHRPKIMHYVYVLRRTNVEVSVRE